MLPLPTHENIRTAGCNPRCGIDDGRTADNGSVPNELCPVFTSLRRAVIQGEVAGRRLEPPVIRAVKATCSGDLPRFPSKRDAKGCGVSSLAGTTGSTCHGDPGRSSDRRRFRIPWLKPQAVG